MTGKKPDLLVHLPVVCGDLLQGRFVRNQFPADWMRRRKADKRRTKKRIRPGGEYPYGLVHAVDDKIDLDPMALSDPVLLHHHDFLRPAGQLIAALQQVFSIMGDLQEPLEQLLLDHHVVAPPAPCIDDLFIRKHGFAGWTPVHIRRFPVG